VRRPPTTLAVLSGLLAVYLIAPFGAGLAHVGISDWRSADLAGLASAGAVSLASASVATALVTICGVPLGYILARRSGRGMALLGFVVQLPLALPPLASGILLLFMLGYSSPLGRVTNGALTDSFTGIVLAEAFVAAPFLIIAARSAFIAVDPVLEDVAATLGHRPWSVFLKVSLPLAWRATAAGMLLAWLRAFGEFGATVMVAYHPYSLPVYTYVAFGSEGLPAMIPVLVPTLLAAISVMIASQFLSPSPVAGKSSRSVDARIPESRPEKTGRSLELVSPTLGKTEASLEFEFHRVLVGFELTVAWRTRTRRLAILGASGSGKSMTLRLIAGLDRSETATLFLDGADLSVLPPESRAIAYVPQSYGLFPHLPVDRQVRFSVNCDSNLASHWAARLGLDGLERRYPSELSTGQQQRVALARALCRQANLLLLDEPFSAIDAPMRARFRREFRQLQQEFDTITILVTHDPAEAIFLADELLLLDHGRVLQTGPVNQVFLRPANETVARLLGAENIGRGRAVAPDCIEVGAGVRLAVSGPPLEPFRPIGWSVRPERIRFVADGPYSARILHFGDVRDGQRTVTVQLGDSVFEVTADPGFRPVNDACHVAIDPQALQIWHVAK
jgi:ABC-type Fe3+/spermidine/putrescine transport system ATPase subunit/ABC-type sulfate transport system permease component